MARKIEPQALSGTAPGAEPADIAEPEGAPIISPTGRERSLLGLPRFGGAVVAYVAVGAAAI